MKDEEIRQREEYEQYIDAQQDQMRNEELMKQLNSRKIPILQRANTSNLISK